MKTPHADDLIGKAPGAPGKPVMPPNVLVNSGTGTVTPAPPSVLETSAAATGAAPGPVTTTVATVTTTTTPAESAVQWYRSQRFIALCQSTVLLLLGWLGTALATNDWTWRPIAIAVLGNVLLQLKDWWNPNVVAPFAALNKNNAPIGK